MKRPLPQQQHRATAEVKYADRSFKLIVLQLSACYLGQAWDVDEQMHAVGVENDTLEGARQGVEDALRAYLKAPDLEFHWTPFA
jgi:hypothetical protein